MSESEQMARQASAEQLASVLDRAGSSHGVWGREEFGALLEHQLATPIEVDLESLPPAKAQQIKALGDAGGLLLKSYGDLFKHPHPPLELLRLVKEFAKAASHAPEGPIPCEVAQVLYYAAIAAALVNRGERITSLRVDALRQGLEWVRAQEWVGAGTKELTGRALACLG